MPYRPVPYRPAPRDISPRLRLGLISWGSGLILAIYYINLATSEVFVKISPSGLRPSGDIFTKLLWLPCLYNAYRPTNHDICIIYSIVSRYIYNIWNPMLVSEDVI